MKRPAPTCTRGVIASLIACALALPAASPAVAASTATPGGEIGTLEQGLYTCELPGDAVGPVGLHVPSADFTVISASSYRAEGRLGSYLLTGTRLVMTNGPHRGQKFDRLSRGFLRQLKADGSEGDLRCVLGRRGGTAPLCPDESKPADPLTRQPQARTKDAKALAECGAAKAKRAG